MATNVENEQILIRHAARLTAEIRQRPVERLLPHALQIESLVSSVNALSLSIARRRSTDSQALITSAGSLLHLEDASSSVSSLLVASPLGAGTSAQRQSESDHRLAMEALSAVTNSAPSLLEAIHDVQTEANWFISEDQRFAHLQPIFTFQKRRAPQKALIQDRLLLYLFLPIVCEVFPSI